MYLEKPGHTLTLFVFCHPDHRSLLVFIFSLAYSVFFLRVLSLGLHAFISASWMTEMNHRLKK
jgi:hypothetical protein